VFQKLEKVNLKLNLGKCCFGSKNITLLGHVVDCNISQPNPKKITIVAKFFQPKITINVIYISWV
jgi:hypothetical protein